MDDNQSINNSNPSEIQKNRYTDFRENENSIDVEKLNNLSSNIELLENKIKQTRNMGSIRNEHNKNQSINIIQEYNETYLSKSKEIPNNFHQVNDYQYERKPIYNLSSKSRPFSNYNGNHYNEEELDKRYYQKQILNNDLDYRSNQDFNSQSNNQEENHQQDKFNMQNSYFNEENNDNLNYHSGNNIKLYKKHNLSTPKLKNFSNLNIGYIPHELSRSPAMRKSIDRSKILRRDYGCYEKFSKSSNFESIDNDHYRYGNNKDLEKDQIFKYDSQYNSSINFSAERFLKNKNFNSSISQNNSVYLNGSGTQNINNRSNNRSPLRKDLIFSNSKYQNKSPISNYNKNASRSLNYSNAFSTSNNKLDWENGNNNLNDDFSIENLKNLSMFTIKSDHHKIKSQNLAKFLYDLVIVDSLSESNKESLSLRTDLSLRDLFDMFDISRRNSISLVDFKDTLKKLNINVPLTELKLAFKRSDIDMDGRLEYDIFYNI